VAMLGMKAGIFIQSPEGRLVNELHLYRSGMEPKRFFFWTSLPELKWPGEHGPDGDLSPTFYQAARYSLSASAFGKEDLMKIAEGLK
jgi:hypothetical protein